MKDAWGQVLNSLFQGLVDEGGRFVRDKALALARRVVSGVRVMMMLAYTVMILCFVCALAAFASALFFGTRQKMIELGFPVGHFLGVRWPMPLWISLGMFLSSGLLLWISASRALWERGLGLRESLSSEPVSQTPQFNISFGSSIDEEKIVDLVERAVAKRVRPQSQSHSQSKPCSRKPSAHASKTKKSA